MARAALKMNVRELAAAAKVSPNTITRIEAGLKVNSSTREAVRRALDGAGVIFVEENGDGPGVRLKRQPLATTPEPEMEIAPRTPATFEERLDWRVIDEAPRDEWLYLVWIGENRPADAAEFPMIGQVSSEVEGRVWDGREYRPIDWFSHYKPLERSLLSDHRFYKERVGSD